MAEKNPERQPTLSLRLSVKQSHILAHGKPAPASVLGRDGNS